MRSQVSTLCLAPIIVALSILQAGGESMPGAASDDQTTAATIAAVNRFNEAFNRHDVDGVMAAMTADCVFEDTSPAPDGGRYQGQAVVRAYWERFFSANADARFDAEDMFGSGDRAVVRWVYRKMRDGRPWHLRGVDVFRVRDGKVSEKFAYVKG